MIQLQNYWIYSELVERGNIVIHTNDINKENWQKHYDSIFNIMLDTIELPETQQMFIRVIFDSIPSKDYVELSLYDYSLNLLFWYLQVAVDKPILPEHFFYKKYITQKDLKKYIDKYFVPQNRKTISIMEMNNIIDTVMYNFVRIDVFSMFLSNTMNMSDFIDLMERNPEVYKLIHSDFSDIELADIKKAGMAAMDRFVDIVKKDTSHCLSYFLRAGEGLNKKQAKEVLINIGTKPDGFGGVFPYQINTNYFMGGVNELISYFMDAATSRFSQIIINKNVGDSGHFSRLIGLNNLNSKLHDDKDYICDVHPTNLQKLYVENLEMVNSMAGQYYRLDPYGLEYRIEMGDTSLVGKTIYKRSPMTCASAARGEGICYRCYGDLAYSNNNINIGKIAAEILSSIIIQRMLSSKHLIDTELVKIVWTDLFEELFETDYNIIRLQSDKDLSKYSIQIDMNTIQSEYEEDENEIGNPGIYMNTFINEFNIITPEGEVHNISTQNYDNIYLTAEFDAYINSKASSKRIEDDVFTCPLSEFGNDMGLFAIKLENSDLTKAYDRVTGILDKTPEIDKYDKNSILQQIIAIMQECNLNVHTVHCEVLLMNQIRSAKDNLQTPRWEYANQTDYKILSLKKSLMNNPSVTVSLMFQNIKKMLIHPETYKKSAPSITDLFFMAQPQEYLSDKYIDRTTKPETGKRKMLNYNKKE